MDHERGPSLSSLLRRPCSVVHGRGDGSRKKQRPRPPEKRARPNDERLRHSAEPDGSGGEAARPRGVRRGEVKDGGRRLRALDHRLPGPLAPCQVKRSGRRAGGMVFRPLSAGKAPSPFLEPQAEAVLLRLTALTRSLPAA